MLLYKARPEVSNLTKEELDRIADDNMNPFGRPKYEWFIDKIQFIQLSNKDVRYWLPHISKFKYKYFKKCSGECYHDSDDICYRYERKKWANDNKVYIDVREGNILTSYRKCLYAIEILYYIMTINQLDLYSDIKQYLKIFYDVKGLEKVKFVK